jgi:prepilin-type N-terminal cleavage/methylation domain-containing protein
MTNACFKQLSVSVRTLYNHKGASLVEMLIVVAIIAILGATSTPFLSDFIINRDFKTSVEDILGDFFEMRQRAISTGYTHRIDFDVAGNRYTASQCDQQGHNCTALYTKSFGAFRGDVRFDPDNPPSYSGGLARTTFLPRGTVLMGSLHLINSKGSIAQITTQITGRSYIKWTIK